MGNFRPARLPAAVRTLADQFGPPSSWVDFENDEYFYPGFRPAGVLDFPGAAFTRACSAWGYVDGVLTEFSDDVPRRTDDGLVLSFAVTRVSLHPQSLNFAGAVGATKTGGPLIDGWQTVDVSSNGEVWHRIDAPGQGNGSFNAGAEVHARVRFELGSSGKLIVNFIWESGFGGANQSSGVLLEGTTLADVIGAGQALGLMEVLAIEPVPDLTDVYDVEVVLTVASGISGLAPTLALGPRSAVSGEDVRIYGSQVTTARSSWILSDPESTTTSAGDIFAFTNLAALGLPPPVLASGYTVYAEGQHNGGKNYYAFWGISDGTLANEIYLTASPNGGDNAVAYSVSSAGDNGTAPLGDGTWPADTNAKVVTSIAPNALSVSIDGGASGTDTTVAMPVSPNILRLARRGDSGGQGSIIVKRLGIWPRAFTDAEREALAAGGA